MKTTGYELIPETVAERDAINALRSAINDYAHSWHSVIFSGRGMMTEVNSADLAHVRELLEAVEVDEFGRDGNGLDIAGLGGALDALSKIKGV